MFPLGDDLPRRGPPVITALLIFACTLVLLWQEILPGGMNEMMVMKYGFVGDRLLGPDVTLAGRAQGVLTLFTSMFMHGGFLHLFGNVVFLWIFGRSVEDTFGHGWFLLFYVLCGAVAGLAQGVAGLHSGIPLVGASGAISGVLGAYLLLFSDAQVKVLVGLGFYFTTFRLPAILVLGFWFMQDLGEALTVHAGHGGIAFWAHVGGFVAGMLMMPLFRPASQIPDHLPWDE